MFLAAVLAFLAVTDANTDFVKENWLNGIPPKLAGTNKGTVTTYLVIDKYSGSPYCTGNPSVSSGTGFDSCMSAPNNGSMKYQLSTKYNMYTNVMYTTSDCTGDSKEYDMPYNTYCSAAGIDGYRYSLVNSTAPWKSQKVEGTVGEVYASADDCTFSGSSGRYYSWFSTTYCMGSTGDDGSAQSVLYTSCANDRITYTTYGDTKCGTKIDEGSFATYKCLSDSEGQYTTRECTSNTK